MELNKKFELAEKLLLNELPETIRTEFNFLYAVRNLSKPSDVLEKARMEAKEIRKNVDEINKNKKRDELEEVPESDTACVQVLFDLTEAEISKLFNFAYQHSEIVWGSAKQADLFRYCCEVGIIPDELPSANPEAAHDKKPICDRPVFVLKSLFPIEYDSLTLLMKTAVSNPLMKLKDAKFAENFKKMTLASCNEFIDTAKYWGSEYRCNLMLLFCRIMGYIALPETDMRQIKKDLLSDDINRFLVEKSNNYFYDLSSDIAKLQKKLLDTVKGQDQTVRTFCEGLFASEIFASGKERTGVKALFLFAGPPGTGKSFLAKQTAKFLGRPYKIFDMTQFAGHEDQGGLIGLEYYWSGSHVGLLTSYVADNPNAILVFDEIEKAHITTLHVFYELLNSGTLTDKYWDSAKVAAERNSIKEQNKEQREEFLSFNPTVSFKDTIIIFTSNAGRSLYEDEKQKNLSSIEKKTFLNALETEINPLTSEPFFPAALVSRVATGFPLLFNHLKPLNLLEIMRSEYKHISGLFEEMYGISMLVDDPNTTGDTHNVLVSILLSEGGMADARTLKARASLFFKTRIHRMLQEIKFRKLGNSENVKSIIFKADLDEVSEDIKNLFSNNRKTRILMFADVTFSNMCVRQIDNCEFLYASTPDEIYVLAEEKDIDFAIIFISENIGSDIFTELRKTNPELPICVLAASLKSIQIDRELIASYLRAGAYGSIIFSPEGGFKSFKEQVNDLCAEIYMLKKVEELSAKRKSLAFNTETVVDGDTAYIKFVDFELRRVTDADDLKNLLADSDIPSERFSDVVGAGRAKEELKFFIDFLKKPEKFSVSGLRPPKGVLLYGPPGTGKTMLAKVMAGEAEVNFISKSANNLNEGYSGSGPKAVRDLFALARKYAPSIIFIDEIDFIGKARGSGNSIANEETLNALLTEMDGFSTDPKKPVFVLAATNYDVESGKGGIGMIDEALSRRFDSRILVDLPNAEERKELIEKELGKIKNHRVTEDGIKTLAERSDVFHMNPSNLVSTINEAKRTAFKKSVANASFQLDDDTLLEAFDIVISGEEKPLGDEYLERIARHEAGHSVVYYLCGNLPAYITVVARSDYGGYMARSSKDLKNPIPTKRDLLGIVRMCLGGYAAESIYYGNEDSDEGLSSGASSDLQNATYIVRNMITQYGMYEEFGLTVGVKESDELTALINKILSEQLKITKELIINNRAMFDKVAAALVNKKKLTEQEFKEICEETSSICG
ncbi:MAG: AAA family ATPase [Ruminococcus sp.]|jgi:ATP-dependent Zn protease|nr:AAA family ATPase [Ruminococcus sp.]